MKNYHFGKASLLATSLLWVCYTPTFAQEQDSLYQTRTVVQEIDNTHCLKVKEVLIPTAVVTASALFVNQSWLHKQRENVQNVLSAKGRRKFKVDDYSQYAPLIAAYGLDICGVKGEHNLIDKTVLLAMSYATMGIVVNAMKFGFKEKRPDSNARNSFPSGHTATAFMGATYLYKEYKDVSPWIGYAGFAVAAATGYLRIYNDRHYFNDVLAGACIGIASVRFAYWLYPKCFKKAKCNHSNNFMVSGLPYYSNKTAGVNISIQF